MRRLLLAYLAALPLGYLLVAFIRFDPAWPMIIPDMTPDGRAALMLAHAFLALGCWWAMTLAALAREIG